MLFLELWRMDSNMIIYHFVQLLFYLILSTISLESHFKFTFSRLISFVALGQSSVVVASVCGLLAS